MKRFPVSACTWVSNALIGAWGLFEAMAMLLPVVEEIIVLDVESSDGTYDLLADIQRYNPRVRVVGGTFPYLDASAFVDVTNETIRSCANNIVLFFEADQIFHEDLVTCLPWYWGRGEYNLAFWVVQYERNFQRVKWFPHRFPMGGAKTEMVCIGDGVRTPQSKAEQEYTGPPIPTCSRYIGEMADWQREYPDVRDTAVRRRAEEAIKPYLHDMVLDVSMTGWCLEDVPTRRRLHAPFYHGDTHLEGIPLEQWLEQERQNPEWTYTTSPFNLPVVVRYHLGKTRYTVRTELIKALQEDQTLEYIHSLKENA